MAGFNFRLETVLQHRRHIEETCQRELAAALAELADEKTSLARLEASRDRYRQELQQKLKSSVTASEMLLFQRYLDRLSLDIASQKIKADAAAQLSEKKRTELIAALKNRKVLEKLKEKQTAAAARTALKQEQGLINEVAVTRHVRAR